MLTNTAGCRKDRRSRLAPQWIPVRGDPPQSNFAVLALIMDVVGPCCDERDDDMSGTVSEVHLRRSCEYRP